MKEQRVGYMLDKGIRMNFFEEVAFEQRSYYSISVCKKRIVFHKYIYV